MLIVWQFNFNNKNSLLNPHFPLPRIKRVVQKKNFMLGAQMNNKRSKATKVIGQNGMRWRRNLIITCVLSARIDDQKLDCKETSLMQSSKLLQTDFPKRAIYQKVDLVLCTEENWMGWRLLLSNIKMQACKERRNSSLKFMYSAKPDIRIWSGCLGHVQKEATGCLSTNMSAMGPSISISQVRMK